MPGAPDGLKMLSCVVIPAAAAGAESMPNSTAVAQREGVRTGRRAGEQARTSAPAFNGRGAESRAGREPEACVWVPLRSADGPAPITTEHPMIDAKQLLERFLGGSAQDDERRGGPGERRGGSGGGDLLASVQNLARNNPLLAGGAAGGLASLLLGSKGGRKLAGGALKLGAIAAIGGLAYKAYQAYQAGQAGPAGQSSPHPGRPTHAGPVELLPPPSDSPFALENAPQGAETFALELVAAMINAAKADGHIDAAERGRIEARLAEAGLDEDERRFLADELARPLDVERVVKAARNKEEAIELYAASLLAITPDAPAERAYLGLLAARLGLEPDLAATIERTVSEAGVSSTAA